MGVAPSGQEAYENEFKDYKLVITPQQDSYTLSRNQDGFVRIDLDGGAGRYRRDVLGSTEKITAKWILSADDYTYLWAIYRIFTNRMVKFKIDLIVEDEGLCECKAWFWPGTFKLSKQVGTTYYCQATLEVEPPEYELDFDKWVVWFFQWIGRDWRVLFERLDRSINYNFPSIFDRENTQWHLLI